MNAFCFGNLVWNGESVIYVAILALPLLKQVLLVDMHLFFATSAFGMFYIDLS